MGERESGSTGQGSAIDELLVVHDQERTAHLTTDVEAMMVHQGDEFVAVVEGGVHVLTGEQMRGIFTQAFEGATYLAFDDVEDPVIRVSDDGSMAWMAVKLRVWKTQLGASGEQLERRFISTGIRTYRRCDGTWLRTGSSGNSVDE